MDIKEKYHNYL